MKICPLFSSSKGNCTYISDDKTSVLVDFGIYLKNFYTNASLTGINLENIKAVFITHEHSDHIKGLKTFLKEFHVPVFGSGGTIERLIKNGIISEYSQFEIICGEETIIDSIAVKTFSTPHDSAESFGYKFEFENGYTAAICTDLGYVTETVTNNLLGTDVVMLESNYDTQLLEYGKYPRFLKKRISGLSGHLSNEDCSNEVLDLVGNATRHFILGHLSEENNRPDIAYNHTVSKLTYMGLKNGVDFDINIAPVSNTDRIFEYLD